MNKPAVGTKEKHRTSNGKLKTTARTKRRRKSQGFSSSFTQKTMHNNTLLAQSLAKEKSRNEKMLNMQRDLIASRNEALMRLNEIETSFERMGMMVKKGIKQLQDIATTMTDLYSEIQLFRNNPRDSASMRNSWEEKSCRTRASTNISRMQTVKPMVDGHMITTQPRISLPRIDSRQENIAANEPSPNRCTLVSTSFSVPAIEEESEVSNSDDDEVRNNSLVCRAPRQSPRLETMQEFYDRVYAQDPQEGPSRPTKRAPPRLVRKVPRGVTKFPGHNFELDSSSDECNVNNTTTLCLVDMDETVVANSPAVESVPAAAEKENKPVFVKTNKELEISPNLSYEKVFAISANAECQTVSEISTTNTTRQSLEELKNSSPLTSDDGANNDTKPPVAPDSPDFLGFPVEDNSPVVKKSVERKSTSRSKLFSFVSTVHTKSPTSKSVSSNSLPHVDRSSSLATSPNVKVSHVPKLSEVCLHNGISPDKGFGIPNSTNGWSGSHFEQESRSASCKGLPKHTNSSPASKSKCRSLVSIKCPTVLLSDVNLTKPKSFADSSLMSDPQKNSDIEVLSETVKKTTFALANCSVVINNQPVHTRTSTLRLEIPNKEIFQLTDISHRKSGKQTTCINTPVNPTAGETPLETKSASECQKVLLIELERLPAVSQSALVQPVMKKLKVSRTRRNTHEDNENTNHAQASSRKGKKRNSPFPSDLYDTPTRRSKPRSPNAVVLVTKLDISPRPSDTLEESSSATNRRALRRIPPLNYKEPSVHMKLRRPY